MKKTYENLQIEVIAFNKKDVITASSLTSDHDNTYTSKRSMMSIEDFESFLTK